MFGQVVDLCDAVVGEVDVGEHASYGLVSLWPGVVIAAIGRVEVQTIRQQIITTDTIQLIFSILWMSCYGNVTFVASK